ncbi:hypothetical protein EDB83DRAFT_2271626 [Lactarius deliciosus]|nr:hypothetical protein EDB83DRAFT_2271626 [Lactarius deliciosus]
MLTHAPETPSSGPVISLENLLFDYPGADAILRSCDSYEFRVLKIYIFHSSPVLGQQVLAADNPQPGIAIPTDTMATSLPVVQLPDSGAVAFSLLTYIFPVLPILPSTVEQVMELLSAAQKYKMDAVLAHIRNHLAQQQPPFIQEENSLYVYSLAQKYGLRQEVLQAAQSTLGLPTLAIDRLDEKFEMMPGVCLHELWKYHQRVRVNLTSDLKGFITSRGHTTFDGPCRTPPLGPGLPFPGWLGKYISSIGRNPSLFDLSRFHMVLTEHIRSCSGVLRGTSGGCHACATIPSKNILEFWAALSAVYRDSITKAEPDLLLVMEGTNFESHPNPPGGSSSQPRKTHMPDADVILQSSDLINFRVRRSILATSSPFFGDLLSLPQPPGPQLVDGLPVVHLPEDAEVLNSLVTMLYPIPPELPDSADNILTLLAACQKYEMTAVQSSIRAEVSRRGLLSPTGAESFRLFAVAYRKRLIPEMKSAARRTLGFPMTFEYLGEALRAFEGCALFDLSLFRQCCRHGIVSRLKVSMDCRSGPSKVWVGCPQTIRRHRIPTNPSEDNSGDAGGPPLWLNDIFSREIFELDSFTFALATPSSFREEYLAALRSHVSDNDCTFCMKTHTLKGEEFCKEIESKLVQAWDVQYSFRIEHPASESTPPPSVSARYFSLGSAAGSYRL